MTPERARELLGGLATGILTSEERQMLFEAALQDQSLFNEVADELEFAAFLQSPDTRAQLANRIEVEPPRRQRWALRPRWLALSGVLAASMVLFVAVWHRDVTPQYSAKVRDEAANAPAPPPASNPVPAETTPKSPPPAAVKQKAEPSGPALAGKRETAPAEKQSSDAGPKLTQDEIRRPAASQGRVASRSFTPANSIRADSAAPRDVLPAPPEPKPMARAAEAAPASPMAAPPPAVPGGVIGGFPAATAFLEGTVHDATGAAVPNASIEIINTATKSSTRAASDSAGRFVAPALPAGGPYTVTAQAPGFNKEERSGITLAANQPAKIDIPLQPGAAAESVSVAAAVRPGFAMRAKLADKTASPSLNVAPQVAVLDFVNSAPQNQSGQQVPDMLSAQLADLLSTQLAGGGQVRVVDRQKVQQAWQAQNQRSAQATNLNSPARPPTPTEAAELGRRVGADAVIVGTVRSEVSAAGPDAAPGQGAANVALTADVIDAKKAVSMAKGAATGTPRSATSQLSFDLQTQLAPPVEGSVTNVDKDKLSVLFNASGEPGVGARLNVFRNQRRIGEVTLQSVHGRSAEGTFSGSSRPRKGDRVTSMR